MHGVHLRAPMRLRSADDLQYAFSNYVRGYIGLLDYIWYDPERLEVQVGPNFPFLLKAHRMLFERKGRRST